MPGKSPTRETKLPLGCLRFVAYFLTIGVVAVLGALFLGDSTAALFIWTAVVMAAFAILGLWAARTITEHIKG